MEHLRTDWNSLNKGTQVKLCRFGNWVDKSWTWTKLRILYHGLQEELFSDPFLKDIMAPGSRARFNKPQLGEKVGMERGNDPVRAFRVANKNNVQLAGLMLDAPGSRFRSRILLELVRPIRNWYGSQSQKVRSTGEHLQWIISEILHGGTSKPLQDTWAQLFDHGCLEFIGVSVDMDPAVLSLEACHPKVVEQDDLASLASRSVTCLAGTRARRMMYLTRGWGGLQVRFASANPVDRAAAAQPLLHQHEAFLAAGGQSKAFWKRLCKRSAFNLVSTQQLLAFSKEGDGQVTEQMMQHVLGRLSGIGQSKVSEDAMGMCRRLEQSAANQGQLPASAVWQHLLDKGLPSEVYRCTEHDWRGVVTPSGLAGKLPAKLFHSRLRDALLWVKDIASSARTPPLHSTDAEGQDMIFVDMLLMEEAKATVSWGSISKGAYLAQLCNGSCLALSKDNVKWYISLGSVAGMAALLWLAQAAHRHGELLENLPCLGARPGMHLVNGSSWFATSFTWACPVSRVLQGACSPWAARHRISAVVPGEPRRLLEEAAAQAFWQISATSLSWFLNHLGFDFDEGCTMLEKLTLLIKGLLPGTSQEELLMILGRRLLAPTQLDEFLLQPDAEDFVDEKDRADFQKNQDKLKQQQASTNAYRDEWSGKVVKHRRSRAAPSSSNPGGHKSITGSPCRGRFPPGEVSAAEAQNLFPAPVRVYVFTYSSRWIASSPVLGNRSRSWRLRGHSGALQQVLQWAWSETLLRECRPEIDCPIAGAFDIGGPA